MDRRLFLKHQAGLAAVAGATSWMVPFDSRAAVPRPLAALPWSAAWDDIDRFDHGHALRDGRQPEVPPPEADGYDVAIIGGGLSGLIAAYRMADRNVVVLEKEPTFGGNSRSRELAGCRYALGAFLSQGAVPPFTGFLRDVQAPFLPLRATDHAVLQGHTLVQDPLGEGLDRLPWSKHDRDALRAMTTDLKAMADPVTGLSFPMENGPAAHRKLDRHTLWDDFERRGLPPRVRELMDVLLSARVGDHGQHLSSWIGHYLLAGLVQPSYTMLGGHGALTDRLLALLRQREHCALRSSFTVLRVQPDGDDAVVIAGMDAQGTARTVRARCAVVGAPKHVAKHLVPGLREERAAAYAALRYNAYLVAQVVLRKQVALPFETVIPHARVARFVTAPDALPGNARQDGGGLLTVYAPFPGAAGRLALLAADAQQVAADIASDLADLSGEAAQSIDRIVLHRWGHPMLTAGPGLSDALASAREPHGRIAFAHSDNLGLTGLYSAVWAGMSAQADAELLLS